MIPMTILERLETCRNGDRPDALRGLGDYLAGLDAAGLAAVRPDLLKLPDLRAADLDGLRTDALRRMEEERNFSVLSDGRREQHAVVRSQGRRWQNRLGI